MTRTAATVLAFQAVLLELQELMFCTELAQRALLGAPRCIRLRNFKSCNSNRTPLNAIPVQTWLQLRPISSPAQVEPSRCVAHSESLPSVEASERDTRNLRSFRLR